MIDVWNPIESCQSVGWWRDAAPDALTSSAYTGELAIYSSDFSAFSKRSYCPSLLRFFWPKYHIRTRFIHLHFGDCLQWNFVLLAVKCHGVSPLSTAVRAIHPHCKCIKCLGFSHARKAVYGISKCKFCENLHLITLRSWLEACEKESSIFPRRAPEASSASRESATWGSDVKLVEMESEQTALAFFLPPSPERVRDYFFPSPRARDTVSFGLDILIYCKQQPRILGLL